MAESRALTQAEIDALLNQMPDASGAGGDVDPAASGVPVVSADRPLARLIKAYDFRRPDKFSKEQWHTLQSMHDTFARQIGAAFSSRLRELITVRLSSIEQGLYEEWQSQVPGQTVCYVLSMAPLDGNVVLEFSTDFAADVVDRLLGGTGLLVPRDRELGEVEIALLRSFGRAIVNTLEDMWGAITPIQVELKDISMDAGLVQIAGANDVVVTALFEVGIGSRLGAMSICLPYTVIEPVAPSLSAQIWRTNGASRHDPRVRAVVERLLRDAPLELAVEVGSATVPVATILEMREGDTLLLERRSGGALPLLVDGHPRFWCRPGIVANQVAVRISEVIAVEEPDKDGPALTIGAIKFAEGVLDPTRPAPPSIIPAALMAAPVPAAVEPMPAPAVAPAVPALNEYQEAASA
jgi:flagellar motor switch protein FliM